MHDVRLWECWLLGKSLMNSCEVQVSLSMCGSLTESTGYKFCKKLKKNLLVGMIRLYMWVC